MQQSVDPDNYTKSMKQRVDDQIKIISRKLEASTVTSRSSVEAQGASYLIRNKAFHNRKPVMICWEMPKIAIKTLVLP